MRTAKPIAHLPSPTSGMTSGTHSFGTTECSICTRPATGTDDHLGMHIGGYGIPGWMVFSHGT